MTERRLTASDFRRYGLRMRIRTSDRWWFTVSIVCVSVAVSSRYVQADDNDLVLSRLGAVSPSGTDITPDESAFRSLSSELGVVLAPRAEGPADTVGLSGFQFSTEIKTHSVSGGSGFWRGAQGSDNSTTDPGHSSSLQTFGLFVKKGLWAPLPSMEAQVGAVKLFDSNLWALQAGLKIALHEGYDDMPIPSIALRGAISRLYGSEQLDLTVGSFDITASKRFGIQATVSVEPFAGASLLWIIPRSQVIDATPQIDAVAVPTDVRMNFVFPEQSSIRRTALFMGAKLRYHVFSVIAQFDYALAGGSTSVRGSGTARVEAEDNAAGQRALALSLAVDL